MKLQRIDKMPAESTDLSLHVDLCASRYQGILDRLESMDSKLSNAADAMIEVKMKLESNRDSTYLKWSIAIISALSAALLHMLTK
jgi:D-arabinose 5-phosphate isomerase GutQ